MTTIFFILKVAGLVTTGAATIAALFRTKGFEEVEVPSLIIGAPRRTERRITREAKRAAVLVVAGLIESLLAQTVEQSLNNKRAVEGQAVTTKQIKSAEEQMRLARESLAKLQEQASQNKVILTNLEQQGVLAKQSLEELSGQSMQTRAVLTNVQAQGVVARESLRRIQDQVENSRKSLAYMERLAFRLERVAVTATYEVFSSDEDVRAMINSVVAWTGAERGGSSEPTVVVRPQGPGAEENGYSVNVVGYVKESRTGYMLTVSTNLPMNRVLYPEKQWMSVPVAALSASGGPGAEGAKVKILALKKFIESPAFVLSLFSQGNRSPELLDADFTAMPVSSKVLPLLKCIPEEGRLGLTWQFELPASCWQASDRMASVPDLDRARVCVFFTNAPANLFTLKPVSLKLDFDKAMVTVTNFERFPVSNLVAALPQPAVSDQKGQVGAERGRLVVFCAVLPTREEMLLGARPSPPGNLRIVVSP